METTTCPLPSNFSTNSTSRIYEVPTAGIVVLSLFYGSISLFTVMGNAVVIWVVVSSRKMQNVTNYFIANLAMADIIIGLFSIPFQFQAALLQRWNLPHFMCGFCPFFQSLSVDVSVFTLVAIAVDRYFAIIHPLTHLPSKSQAQLVILAIWVVATFLSLPMVVAWQIKMRLDKVNGGTKFFCQESGMSPISLKVYRNILFLVQYVIPVIVISFAYVRIGTKLWGNKTPGNAETTRDAAMMRNKKKVIKMLVIVVALFSICWLPLQAYMTLQGIYPEINEYKYINIVWFCIHWLAMSNSCYNPFIYAIYNVKFQKEFKSKFNCWKRKDNDNMSELTDGGWRDKSCYNSKNNFPYSFRQSRHFPNRASNNMMTTTFINMGAPKEIH